MTSARSWPVLFVSPPKLKAVDSEGRPVERLRGNVSVAALAICGALQEGRFDMRFVDCVADATDCGPHAFKTSRQVRFGMTDAEFAETVADLRPAALLVSSLFTTDHAMFEAVVRTARRVIPDIFVVTGGIHATALPHWHLERGLADVVVLGEGEERIAWLMDTWRSGGDIAVVPGIAYRTSDGTVITTSPPLSPRGDGPWAVDLIAMRHDRSFRYDDDLCRRGELYRRGPADRTFVLFGSRGCPVACAYCSSTPSFGRVVRHVGAERMWSDFAKLRHDYGVATFYNQSDTLLLHEEDRQFLKRVASYRRETADVGFALNNPNAFFVRLLLDHQSGAVREETLDLLRDSGFNVVTVAAETFVRRFNRKFDPERLGVAQMRQLAEAVRRRGMKIELYMMYAFPSQTEAELRTDIGAIDSLCDTIDSVSWSATMILPRTELFARALAQGWFTERSYRAALNAGYGFGQLPNALNFTAMSSNTLKRYVRDHGLGPGCSRTETQGTAQTTKVRCASAADLAVASYPSTISRSHAPPMNHG